MFKLLDVKKLKTLAKIVLYASWRESSSNLSQILVERSFTKNKSRNRTKNLNKTELEIGETEQGSSTCQ